MKLRRTLAATFAVAAAITASGAIPVKAGSTLTGSGSSFVANMMNTCVAAYNKNTVYNANTDVVSYTSSSSGGGKGDFGSSGVGGAGSSKFAGTESAYTSSTPSGFVYVPMIAGPIAIGYRLDNVTPANSVVNLKAETVAKIFAGQITMWNDAQIKADNTATTVKAVKTTAKNGVTVTATQSVTGSKVSLKLVATKAGLAKFKNKSVTISRTLNGKVTKVLTSKISKLINKSVTYSKGATYAIKIGTTSLGSVTVDDTIIGTTLTLPATPIRVAYRSGNSGTTFMFTNYLNKVLPSIWSKPAAEAFGSAFPGSSIPTGTFQSASGNDGVANDVKNNNGGITYAEVSFIDDRADYGLKSALVANNAGVYVAPTSAASSVFYAEATVESNGLVTPDYTVKAADAYLINAIAYGLAGTAATTENAGVKSFFSYFLSRCAPVKAAGEGYAALSGAILTKALAQVAKINAG